MPVNILIVSLRAPELNTSSSIRLINTIRSLWDAGANITILTTKPPDNSLVASNNVYIVKKIKRVNLPATKIYSLAVSRSSEHKTIKAIKSLARNLYYRLSIYDPLKGCTKYINKLEQNLLSHYDLVLSMSDPKSSHYFTLELIRELNIRYHKYIQIWGDPFSQDISIRTFLPKKLIEIEENKLLEKADKIFYVSPLTLELQKKIFVHLSSKMDILFPCYEKAELYESVSFIKKIGYFGDYHSSIRNIIPLYNAIKQSRYELVICGSSDIKLKGTENIKILNHRVSQERIKELEKEVDLLVHLSNCRGSQIPSKIYYYMGTNKPILFILDGNVEALKRIFEPYKRVIFCNNNEADILDKIDMYNKKEIKLVLSPIEDFNNKKISEKILSLFI